MAHRVELGMIKSISVKEVKSVPNNEQDLTTAIAHAADEALADTRQNNARSLSVIPWNGKLYVVVGGGEIM